MVLAKAASRAERVADLLRVFLDAGSAEKLFSVRWIGEESCSESGRKMQKLNNVQLTVENTCHVGKATNQNREPPSAWGESELHQ